MTQIIYVSSPNSQQIYVWKLDNYKKKLELLQIVSTPGEVQPIVIHPNKQLLYVGIRPNFNVITYSINTKGLLNKIGTTKIFSSPTYLSINTQGTFLYCASYNYNSISVISISTSGIPSDCVQTVSGLLGCHSVNIDKTEKCLWVPCLREHSIRIFHINTFTGILTPHKVHHIITTSLGSGPRHMTFHNFDFYAYVINELNGTINVIKYDLKDTIPTIIQTSNLLPQNHTDTKQFWAADIHITPDNRWLYCSERLLNTISCFKILSTTKQLEFSNYYFTEIQPRGFSIDNTGKFLIIAGQKSNRIALYSINKNNGRLYFISNYQSGFGPIWIEVLNIIR